jgi:hypothetical protein
MLISGLYDIMFVMFLNAKLITLFKGEVGAMVSLGHPNSLSYDEIYDVLFEIQTPLSALVSAGPYLFESIYGSDRCALDKIPVDVPQCVDLENQFFLSVEEVDRLELVLVSYNGYGLDLLESIVELSKISGEFCRQSHSFFYSTFPIEVVSVCLVSSYVEKAKVCASKDYILSFP